MLTNLYKPRAYIRDFTVLSKIFVGQNFRHQVEFSLIFQQIFVPTLDESSRPNLTHFQTLSYDSRNHLPMHILHIQDTKFICMFIF